jgi:hypothetical protein
MNYAKRFSFCTAILFHSRFNCVIKEFWHEKQERCRLDMKGEGYVGEEYERRENAEQKGIVCHPKERRTNETAACRCVGCVGDMVCLVSLKTTTS